MHITPHQPLQIKDLTITFGNKNCITQPFSGTIYYGDRIAIIGRNGSGKTSLIKVIADILSPSDGNIKIPHDINIAYVPQLIDNDDKLSGGQKFNQRLSEALALQPNLLLLDEPTNHLDSKNRRSLISMLNRYQGTLITVTHDTELLRNTVDTIWHVANGSITVFNGKYDEYLEMQKHKEQALISAIKDLNLQKVEAHEKLMQEQHRASNSKMRGKKQLENKKWPTVKSAAKMGRAATTSVNKKAQIEHKKQNVINELQDLYVHEVLIPKFNLEAFMSGNKAVLSISNGSCGYNEQQIVSDINISLQALDKIIIHGDNASGKSTILKAILGNISIVKSGEWICPNSQDIGYLDQHYSQLDSDKTAVELISNLVPTWKHAEIRDHLNKFLLRKNEEVNLATRHLSGGEKVRLSLALIAAKPPKLLLLDEITNNVDIETKEHLIQVLNNYPGAFILICHEQDFATRLRFTQQYQIQDGKFNLY